MLALSALRGLAGATTGLALLALGFTVFGIRALWRLRRDRLTLEAAERSEAVDMTTVVKRHVPSELQSNSAGEEFILVRQSIAKRFPRWFKRVVLSSVVVLTAGPISWILIDRNWQVAAQLAQEAPKPVDALKAIAGVWGGKYELPQSCSEKNALAISVTDGNKGLSFQYNKPLVDGSRQVSRFEYTIVGVEPNKLILEPAQYPKQSDSPRRLSMRWYFVFSDADTYRIGHGDDWRTTDDIVRCH
jgi:hypothetical protein